MISAVVAVIILATAGAVGTDIMNTSQPGVIYEKGTEVRFTGKTWKIAVVLNTDIYRQNVSGIARAIAEAKAACPENQTRCTPIPSADLAAWHELRAAIQEFKRIEDEQDKLKFNMTEEAKGIWVARAKGIQNTTEKIKINNTDGWAMLESDLSRTEEIKGYQGKAALQDQVESQINQTELIKLYEKIKNQTAGLKMKGEIISDAMVMLNSEYLHPYFIMPGSIKELLRKLEEAEIGTESPVGEEIHSFRQFEEKMLNVRVGIGKKYVLLEFDLPMITKERAHSIKISTFPVPQETRKNTSDFLQITSVATHMLITSEGYYSLKFNESKACIEQTNVWICPPRWFNYTQKLSCEYALLTQPSRENYKLCHIEYRQGFKPIFLRLQTINAWFYITKQPIKAQEICDDGVEKQLELYDSGIIDLSPQCRLFYEGIQMRAGEQEAKLKSNLYTIPNLSLQVREITTLWTREVEIRKFRELVKLGVTDFWKMEQICQEKNPHLAILIIIILTAASVIMLLLLAIIAYKCKPRIKLYPVHTRRSQGGEMVVERRIDNNIIYDLPIKF